MAELKVIFERKFIAEILPKLRAGMSNSWRPGLVFELDDTFFEGVKTAAVRSVVGVCVMFYPGHILV
jgi:hypothetical protein